MAKADDSGAKGQKTYTLDTVAVLLMAANVVSISRTQYEMMSSLDGTRTADSFQHQLREVLKKAKELKARVDDGEKFAPVAPAKNRGPATPKKRNQDEMSSQPSMKSTPAKKAKAKKTQVKAEPDSPEPSEPQEFFDSVNNGYGNSDDDQYGDEA
ncbi:hypothetical protein BU16DRAFT_579552 [Lophium mytilinum]|uniref:Uncharacterized protein n=1 Tax=Lophium mytilinum TaxID=390894 RepID=A0A6A6R4Q8_9PEZI|nr:hypothetical protein BU16DRAFT_579552 [Lophium mytilinum]